jgi:hypothetical protein
MFSESISNRQANDVQMRYKKSKVYQYAKNLYLTRIAPLFVSSIDEKLPSAIYDQPHFLKISYCTVCMGRAHHLKATYLKNIQDNINYPNVEFVLLNYNSPDDMDTWVVDHLSSYIANGKLVYLTTSKVQTFHASKAKNLAHRSATGDILVNLDADNFLGKDNAFYINYLFNTFKEPPILAHFTRFTPGHYDNYGRIAVTSEVYHEINGYREDFAPTKLEDADFIKRSKLAGVRVFHVRYINFIRSIKHTDEERLNNIKGTSDLIDYANYNRQLMEEGLKKGIYRAENKNENIEINRSIIKQV